MNDHDAGTLARLLASDDGRRVGLGLELLADLAAPVEEAELSRLLDDDRPVVRPGDPVRRQGSRSK